MIHPFPSGQDLEDLIHEGRIIVNKNKLPKDLQEDKLSYALEEGMISLNDFFNESGYVVANVNEMVKLSNRIETVVDKIDRFGQLFYEINFS